MDNAVNWDKAIDRLKAGRCIGELVDAAGKVCLLGAVGHGMGLTDEYMIDNSEGTYAAVRHVAGDVLVPIISEQFPERHMNMAIRAENSVINFNDYPATDDEALLVLEKARANH